MTRKKEIKPRAPGGGRPKIPEDQRKIPISFSLSPAHADWLKGKKNKSLIIETALERYLKE